MPLLRKSKLKTPKFSSDDPYLSYYDVRLTYEDVRTIKNEWLTDSAISFFEEYLEREKLIHYPKARVVLLRPSMAYMIMSIPDPRSIRDALPDFSSTTHVFLPINNNPNPRVAEGGSHWSLLVISLIDKLAFHYDSLEDTNVREARHVARNFERMYDNKFRLRFRTITPCPQQKNHVDCGVYVCMFIQTLLFERLLSVDTTGSISMCLRSGSFDAAAGRHEMLRIISEMRTQGLQSQGGKLVAKPSTEWLRLMNGNKRSKPSSPAPPTLASSSAPTLVDSAEAFQAKRRRISPPSSDNSLASSVFSYASKGQSTVSPASSELPSDDSAVPASTETKVEIRESKSSKGDKADKVDKKYGNRKLIELAEAKAKKRKRKALLSATLSPSSVDAALSPSAALKVKRMRETSVGGSTGKRGEPGAGFGPGPIAGIGAASSRL